MALAHNSTIADSEPAWSDVDKTALPRSAFADHGEEGVKSSWKYPHHWVQGGGDKDDNGIYTSGTMYLHTGGWQAAINAAHGARSGEKAGSGVTSHLEQHRSAVESHRERKAKSFMSISDDNPKCWANHLGIWVIEPMWMSQAIESIKGGFWTLESQDMQKHASMEPQIESAYQERPYTLTDTGVAIIPMHGPMMKAASKFGGTSTINVRKMIRDANKDYEVKTILLHIYSPGGHVAGTQELADEVYNTRLKGKNIVAHIDDLGASGAYWVASQAAKITANATAEVGSIGTVAVLTDDSARNERLGVRVHVVSTGAYKGVGAPGASISAEALDYIKSRVENLNEHFQASIKRGRVLTPKQLADMSDGRVHIAAQAKAMAMIDAICSFEQALEQAGNYSLRELQGARAEEVHRGVRSARQYGFALSAFRQSKGV